jgi:hypothetical protein
MATALEKHSRERGELLSMWTAIQTKKKKIIIYVLIFAGS